MKKTIIKLFVCCLVFLLATFIVNQFMNRGHDNLTMEMAPASYPIVTMVMNGMECNELHGYGGAVDIAFQRDAVTVLGESRDTGFVVDTYGAEVSGISIQVRSSDGTRLIEDTEITDYFETEGRISGTIALKDLIERDTEYSLTILITLGGEKQISYYTKVVWSDSFHVEEKLDFCRDFHERLYDKEAARELTKYLESNARLEDNKSYHKVNIYSSFRQITWGDLGVVEIGEPVYRLTEIAEQTASVLTDYMVATSEEGESTYYRVKEYFRLRYTADRIYLLTYERTMTQMPERKRLCVDGRIELGITDADVDMLESEDGNVVVFETAKQLYCYNITTNKLAAVFSFYDAENADARTMYDQHDIKILNVDEGGNVQFAVYGYMNRGRHEGEVGIQLYTYNSGQNTVEELLYIPYDRPYSVLAAQMEELLYLNREQKLYLVLDGEVYGIDLVQKTYSPLIETIHDEGLQVSENHKIIVWPSGEDIYHSDALNIQNLGSDTRKSITVPSGEVIRPLGFMDEDIIYGIAHAADVTEENSGRILFPMHTIRICNSDGELLKEYGQTGIYVTECTVEANQITLDRVRETEPGYYQEIEQDHVMNNMEEETGKNVVTVLETEKYKQYIAIQMRKTTEGKSAMILTPKEVMYEGGRRLSLPERKERERYYVYGAYGVCGIFYSPSRAVNLAYGASGMVMDEGGQLIWRRGNRAAKNQIMAIKEAEATPENGALTICLNTMLSYEGINKNTQYYLERGETILEILQESLSDTVILDLAGCGLDAVLYYVNQDIPVLALTENEGAVLLVGFNEIEVGIMNPSTGSIYTMKNSEAAEWFGKSGNQFITYLRK
ncbi:MAG: hypothetical protein HFH95_00025 [Lachnospiraceae bacterium]|nr:hypothetical protein [uncultured Acetatifactor sp.]MCI8541707.1 hypothetical protein [Lachnospiraceae bacterium]